MEEGREREERWRERGDLPRSKAKVATKLLGGLIGVRDADDNIASCYLQQQRQTPKWQGSYKRFIQKVEYQIQEHFWEKCVQEHFRRVIRSFYLQFVYLDYKPLLIKSQDKL